MDQVFYRQPLKTDKISFVNTIVEHKKKPSGFSFGNSGEPYVSRATIPVYFPELDNIEINFD